MVHWNRWLHQDTGNKNIEWFIYQTSHCCQQRWTHTCAANETFIFNKFNGYMYESDCLGVNLHDNSLSVYWTYSLCKVVEF